MRHSEEGPQRSARVRGVRGEMRRRVGAAEAAVDAARVAAERALAAQRSSESHVARLVAENIIGVVVAADDRILEANDAFLRIVGYSREDLEAGRVHWRQITPPEYAPLDDQALLELLERGSCTPFEKAYWRKDGSLVPILLGATMLEYEPPRWVCFVVDLSERRRLEEVVSTQAAQLQTIFDTIGDALFVYDASGQVQRVNAAGRALLGLDAPTAERHYARELGPRLDVRDADGRPLPVDQYPLFRALRGERLVGTQAADIVFRSLDGREGHTNVVAAPIYDGQGSITGAVLAIRDVTERRRLEHELADRAGLLDATIDAMADGMIVLDATGNIVRMNAAMRRLYGVDACPDLLTLPLPERAQLLATRTPDGRPLEPDEFPSAQVLYGTLTPGTGPMDVVITNLAGRELTLSATGAQLRDVTGGVTGGVLLYRDVTAQRQLERERAQLLGIVAHDLGNPLTTVKAQTQMLQRRADHGELLPAQALDSVLHAARRMERLVGDLRVQESLEAGGLELDWTHCDLVGLVRGEAEAMQAATGRPISVDLPEAPVVVEADPDRIGQVLGNLLSNAIKYSPPDQPVTVKLTTACVEHEQRGDGVARHQVARVNVQDQGPGVPSEALPRLFNRFYRVPGIVVQQGSGGGLGLGLYICRELVERHGGQMGVDSVLGEGSTFWFTLPLGSSGV